MPGPGSRACPKPERIVDKVRNHMRRRLHVSAEEKIMRAVRKEDRYCRFALCSCGRLKLGLEVAHAGEDGHRGMGGNRSLSRTTPENLLLICRPRHRAHKFSIDKKTLQADPLTPAGMRGPVRWLIDMDEWDGNVSTGYARWFELARETSPHQLEPLTDQQRAMLLELAEMKC